MLKLTYVFFNQNGKTALHFAAIKENTEVAKMLIDAGIDINLQEKVSLTWFALLDK